MLAFNLCTLADNSNNFAGLNFRVGLLITHEIAKIKPLENVAIR